MTTITIELELLVRIEKELFLARNYGGILRDEPLLKEVSAALSAPATESEPILWASYYGDRLGNVYKTPELAAEYRAYNGIEMPRVVPLCACDSPQPERKPMTAKLGEQS